MKLFITPLDDKSRQTEMIRLGRTSKFYGKDSALNAVVSLIEKYQVPIEDIVQKIEENKKNDLPISPPITIQEIQEKTAVAEFMSQL